MVLNQTLGLNTLRQDLNRLYYAAPIGSPSFGPGHFFGASSVYGPTSFFHQAAFAAPQPWPGTPAQGHYVPRTNVADTPETTVITVELPGVDAGHCQLSLQGNALVLEGIRQPGGLVGDRLVAYQHTEGRFGGFRWACAIPNGTIASQIDATFRNGLLTIALPKTATGVGLSAIGGSAAIGPAPVAQIVISPAVNG